MTVDPSSEGKAIFREWMAANHPNARIIDHTGKVRGRLPFASRMLTYATGGGVPFGHWVRMYGPEGSGKTLNVMGMMLIGQNYPEFISHEYELRIKAFEQLGGQKLKILSLKAELSKLLKRFPNGLEFCVFDTEQRFETTFAERLGVDMSRVELIDSNIIEEIIDQTKKAVEHYHVIVIDSVSNAQSVAEANLEPGSYEQGTAAQAWKRLRQVRTKLDREENIIVFVDQVRMQLGRGPAGKGRPKAQPSQIRFLKHNISQDVEFEKGGKLWLDKNGVITDDYEKGSSTYKAVGVNAKEVAGLDIRGKVLKQSTGKPDRPYRMRFRFDVANNRTGELVQEVSFDEEFELFECALDFGIIEKGGGGNYVVLDDEFNPTKQKARGAWNVRAMIAEDEELADRIAARLLLAT